MEILVISIVAFIGSGLSFFSGFGLGTILLPAFALFFPVEVAIGLTAIVHFLNNLYKLILVGPHADKSVLLRFSLTALPAAFLGSYLLTEVSHLEPIHTYFINGREFNIEIVKLAISFLIIIFLLFEVLPKLSNWTVDKKYLPLGGFLSGFFGGLSGHQGALRSAFLIRTGLSKEAFIGTGVETACLIDITRLIVYGSQFSKTHFFNNTTTLIVATGAAFIGAFAGNKLLKKATFKMVQKFVTIMLFIISIILGAGLI